MTSRLDKNSVRVELEPDNRINKKIADASKHEDFTIDSSK